MSASFVACHPEAGEARRGTSQALKRFREPEGSFVNGRLKFGVSPKFQMRGPSARYASLGMTHIEIET
jgi:hypothetical protein